jgi:DNA invertase Pin-like site-specific DNA recombinase
MRIGYARVSTIDQSLDLQRDALDRAGCVQVYEENGSGKTADRPQLSAVMKALRPGDCLVVWRLDRLGRNLSDLVTLVGEMDRRGVNFESITENLETHSVTGKLIFHIFAALAEFERSLIRERTMAGLKAARARGRMGGRPAKLSPRQVETLRAMLAAGKVPVLEVARVFGIGKSTLYRHIAEPAA